MPRTTRPARGGKKRKTQGPNGRRTRPRVFVSEPAFISLVTAAAEAYRRECYGVLLGTRRRGLTRVMAAVAYQSARRKPTSVDLAEGRRRTVRRVLRAFPRYNYLGEFHSHPGYGANPGMVFIGEGDLVGVRHGDCELIIAVRRPRIRRRWQHCQDGRLSGTAGGYFLKLGAYLADGRTNGRIAARIADLRCPYAVTTASSPRLLRELAAARGP